jgi:hypothetical protein
MFGFDSGFHAAARTGGLLDWFWRARVALGGALMAAGVLVLLFPQILVWIVAGSIFGVGLSLLGSGLRARARLRGHGADHVHTTTHTQTEGRTRVEFFRPR